MSVKTIASSSAQTSYLDWNQRPESLKSKIEEHHVKQSAFTESYEKKCDSHAVCNLNEFKLLKAMINDAYPAQKEFNVVEIGSRKFEWCQELAKIIENPKNDLPKDIKVRIFGIRNEKYLGERLVETSRCKIYQLGGFKVEDLFAKFKELNFDLEKKVDMAISTWEFRNQFDPVGTVAQCFNLLRKNGYLLTNGFYFLPNDEELNTMPPDFDAPNKRLIQLFLDLKAPFLTKHVDLMRSLDHFILKKPDENPCQLPMSYLDTCEVDGHPYRIDSHTISRYKREPQPSDREEFRLHRQFGCLSGDKSMYAWLKKNDVFHCENDFWEPLQAKDDALKLPPLHQAVAKGDVEQMEKLLEEGHDIDESSSGPDGSNALHVAISKIPTGDKYYTAFNVLMDWKPNLNLFNSKGLTPLHEAVLIDNPLVMQELLAGGADVNAQTWGFRTPLSLAIDKNKEKAIEILCKSGATISKSDEEALRKKGYYNLHLKIRLAAV